MAEIKERINDMKSIEKLIEEYDKEHGKNKWKIINFILLF
jgi:hypothetical protein